MLNQPCPGMIDWPAQRDINAAAYVLRRAGDAGGEAPLCNCLASSDARGGEFLIRWGLGIHAGTKARRKKWEPAFSILLTPKGWALYYLAKIAHGHMGTEVPGARRSYYRGDIQIIGPNGEDLREKKKPRRGRIRRG